MPMFLIIPDSEPETFGTLIPGTNEFLEVKGRTLKLEHSLVSLAKWEALYEKPFMENNSLPRNETLDYIRCMTITQNVDPNVYLIIDDKGVQEVDAYIKRPMTATKFSKRLQHKLNRDIITSEIIYYWMVVLEIPFECQRWHLNRLLTLINVCNLKNQKKNPMAKSDILRANADENARRRAMMNSKG